MDLGGLVQWGGVRDNVLPAGCSDWPISCHAHKTPSRHSAATPRLGDLARRQVLEQARHCNQLFVIAILHDTAVLQNDDPVGLDYR